MSKQKFIVVGVDGGHGGLRAAEYAGMVAKQRGMSVLLVHAYHVTPIVAPADGPLDSVEQPRSFGEDAVQEAAARVAGTAPGVPIECSVVLGYAPTMLARASKGASLVVVGRRPIHGVERLVTRSTTTAVASHASAPVVCVPARWSRENEVAPVTVGVDPSEQGRDAVAYAFAEASRRGCGLQAVHIVPVTLNRLNASANVWAPRDWLVDAELVISELLAGYAEQYPDVPVVRIVDWGSSAGSSLARRAEASSLLVVGARGHGGLPGLSMGRVARSALAHATVPVVVVHRGDAASTTEAERRYGSAVLMSS